MVGSLLAGTRSCLRTLSTSMSHLSMCFTTFPVSLSNTCVVPPAAASLGFHGKSMMQLHSFPNHPPTHPHTQTHVSKSLSENKAVVEMELMGLQCATTNVIEATSC